MPRAADFARAGAVSNVTDPSEESLGTSGEKRGLRGAPRGCSVLGVRPRTSLHLRSSAGFFHCAELNPALLFSPPQMLQVAGILEWIELARSAMIF